MSASDRTLYLVDGHAQIFRAYYAIRGGLNSPKTGEPTNAVFGFASMLLKLFNQFQPRYVAMAIDMPGKTFRDELYPEYKGTREAAPTDLPPQIPRIIELTKMFGIPVLGVSGAEADDVIATVTRRVLQDPRSADVCVRIVSKDKDLEQLLGERVCLFDIHTDTTIDAAWLRDNRGITPEQVIDLLTLTGDTVDNVKGVAGVGPKTAAQLIAEFGSVAGIYENLDKIKGKRRENLQAAHAEGHLPRTRQLVTLKDDVELPFTLDVARVERVDLAGIRRMFDELAFRRLIGDLDKLAKRLGENMPTTTPTPEKASEGFSESLFGEEVSMATATVEVADPSLTTAKDCNYCAVTTPADLHKLVAELRDAACISIDTETMGLAKDAPLCGICLSAKPHTGYYVPTRCPIQPEELDEKTVLAILRPLLEDPAVAKCGHNLKYDWLILRHAGIELRGIAFDSMIAAFLIGSQGLGLDHLARELLRHQTISISTLLGAGASGGKGKEQRTMDQVPLEQVTQYAAEDADVALRLCELMGKQLNMQGLTHLAETIEMPLVEVLATMEFHGIRLDPKVLDEQKAELSKTMVELRDQIHELAGEPFNLDSPKQLAQVLFTTLKLPVIKKTKTGPSTDVEVLEKLADLEDAAEPRTAVPRLLMEYRLCSKLVGTYLGNLVESVNPRTGRIHASFHQTGAATGRLSSSDPNLQNIPIRTDLGRQIRKAFVAEPGHLLISSDYSQIELRILAHLSGDPALIRAFEQDADIHTAVAAQVFGVEQAAVSSAQRAHAKVINFGIIYGVTPYGLARRIEGLDVEGARKLITDYRRRFAGIDTFLQTCVQQARDKGFVTTITGRRRAIPQVKSGNPNTRSLGERLAINTVVQGSAADLIKLAMVNLHRRIQREKLPLKLLLQIHDELVLETPREEAEAMAAVVRHEMEHAMDLRVPLKVEAGVGADWLSAK